MAARKKKSAEPAPEAPESFAPGSTPAVPGPVRPGSPYLGTSGFDYDAWVGSFYPKSLKRKERLGYYSSRFGGLEVNASFYRKPTVETAQAWCAQVPASFRFVLMGWQRVTHQKRLRDCAELVTAFAAPVRALGDRMGPVLWQLPPNLKKDAKLLRDFLAILPKDLRAAFEFRHDSWNDDEIHTILAASGAALCAADTDEKPAQRPVVRTAPFGYFRLRSTEYDEAALVRWADEVWQAGFTSDVYVFFKHEDEACGPAFATAFEHCLVP